MPENFISLRFQNTALSMIKQGLKQNLNFILLLGKSGSGKSMLLKKLFASLSLKKGAFDEILLFSEPFFDEKSFLKALSLRLLSKEISSFEALFETLKTRGRKILIMLDEAGVYEESLLEKIRILSDLAGIFLILSAHKKQEILTKEHFKSRIKLEILLESISKSELKGYLESKFDASFKNTQLSWLLKKSQNNLRSIDKIMHCLKQLELFYGARKKMSFLLEMSAFHHQLLGAK